MTGIVPGVLAVIAAVAGGVESCACTATPVVKMATAIHEKEFRIFTVPRMRLLGLDLLVLAAFQDVARIEGLLVVDLHDFHAAGDVVDVDHADGSGIPFHDF